MVFGVRKLGIMPCWLHDATLSHL